MDYKPLYELEGDADDFAKLLEFLDEPYAVAHPMSPKCEASNA